MRKSIMSLIVGALAGLLIIIDWLIAPLFYAGGNFVWVAFVSWTVFFSASVKERFATILASAVATFLVNAFVMYLVDVKFLTIAGIFVGIAMTFSRVGVGLEMWGVPILLVIITYGAFGLVCGYVCTKMSK